MRDRSLETSSRRGVRTSFVYISFIFINGVTFGVIFGFSVGISVSDHSVFGHGSNDGEEISFFISTFGGEFVFNSESVAHLSGDF